MIYGLAIFAMLLVGFAVVAAIFTALVVVTDEEAPTPRRVFAGFTLAVVTLLLCIAIGLGYTE